MNKKELIKKYNNECFATISTDEVLEDLKQLDEPQKVVVPQFVADWIEECKNDDFHLFGAMEAISLNRKKLDYWFREDDNMELFARAWLDGYEVEEEKRYIIKLKGVPDGAKFLKYAKVTQEWYFGMKEFYSDREIIHTRKELEEANFGWVFSCEGIEIEEVEK
jgi:hypothetical protein|nr:MAG TPA: Protein of unknown function (DUF1642) [Caudoviricetes sp.]